MVGLIVILLYAFKLAFLASLACVKTKVFSLKSEVKKAHLHAHKRILIMPSIMKEVYRSNEVIEMVAVTCNEAYQSKICQLVSNHLIPAYGDVLEPYYIQSLGPN